MIRLIGIMCASALVLSGCLVSQHTTPACNNADGALDNAGFVIVNFPSSGDRVKPGFKVRGCSRTFESNVPWKLLNRDGDVISSGYTNGGGVGGFAEFTIEVMYEVSERQFGQLIIYEDDPSDGEGYPPKHNTIPLILEK